MIRICIIKNPQGLAPALVRIRRIVQIQCYVWLVAWGIVQILQLCESDGNFWYCANPTPIAGKSGAKPPALREQIKLYVLLLELVDKNQLKN